MCSMRGGGAAGRKVMWVLMVAMLPGVVEAGKLVRDACQTFGSGYFENGCSMGCGANTYSGNCSATERTPAECDAKCVRHRLPDCCVARALHHLVLHTLVRVLISLIACSPSLSSLLLSSLLLNRIYLYVSTFPALLPRCVSARPARPLRCRCSSPAPLRSSTR